ncbi:MAG: aldehyde ferredoxin oxidoreductase N-terminal domain-containing protein [Candidatus Hadarchaeales archaeon]
MENRVAFVDAGRRELRVSEVRDPELLGPVDWGLHCHLDLYRSYLYPPYDEHNVLCLGMGKLAGSCIPGTHRLTLCFRSPLWEGFFFSTIGGAAYAFRHLGVDYLTVEGKADTPLAVALKGTPSGLECRFREIPLQELFEIYREHGGEEGVYALQDFLLEEFGGWYRHRESTMEYRVLCVGPASLHTNLGGVFSSAVKGDRGELGSEDWAARGGPGSVLARAHGVVALVVGGKNEWRRFPGANLADLKEADRVFQKLVGKGVMKAASEATVKYRYDGSVGSGGTFGVNYFVLREMAIMFGWSTVNLPKERRLELYERLIRSRYLKQFDGEITSRKHLRPSLEFSSPTSRPWVRVKVWKNCGEPCPGVCKKVRDKYKKDYEPYEANGPNCGIFDQRAAERAVYAVDSLGFDAIEFGNTCGWLFECLHLGLLHPHELGLDGRPSFDPLSFDPQDSERNAALLERLARAVAYGENELSRWVGEGVRRAAREFTRRFGERVRELGKRFEDLAVYVAFGEGGSITPAMYWSPGNFMPVPIQGKYFTFYHSEFREPEEFAELCYQRAVKEMYSENNGLCRFHRGWSERILPHLLEEAWGVKVDYDAHCRKILWRIAEYNRRAGVGPVFFEGERVMDVVTSMAREFSEKSEGGRKWWARFQEDKKGAAREYWERFRERYERLLANPT